MKIISLVMPVYNGEKILPTTFQLLTNFFSNRPYLSEVLFVNDGSIDATKQLLEDFKKQNPFTVKIINQKKNSGKGAAVRLGITNVQSASDYIFFCDDDIPFGFEPLEAMYRVLESDAAVGLVTADRTLTRQNNPYPWHRRVGSFCYGLLMPQAIARDFPDMHGGLKGFHRQTADLIFSLIKNPRWSFDPEIFLIAKANNIKVVKVAVHFLAHVAGTHFKIKDFISVANEIIRLRFNYILGRYRL